MAYPYKGILVSLNNHVPKEYLKIRKTAHDIVSEKRQVIKYYDPNIALKSIYTSIYALKTDWEATGSNIPSGTQCGRLTGDFSFLFYTSLNFQNMSLMKTDYMLI